MVDPVIQDHITKYVICRVVGNELPPRDANGSRLKSFRYILDKEFVDPDAIRLWILNRIIDVDLLAAVKEAIVAAGELYVELDVDWAKYATCHRRGEKLSTLIGINNARNVAFHKARSLGRMAVVLDADCFFDRPTWNATKAFIEEDQQRSPNRQYYAIPIVRLQLEELDAVNPVEIKDVDEPVLAIRSDATELFEEGRPFGSGDKVQFLLDLGVRHWDGRWYALSSDGPCAVGGRVIHVSAGEKILDLDNFERGERRRQSLDILLRKADASTSAVLLKRQGLRRYLNFKILSELARMQHEIRRGLRSLRLPLFVRNALARMLPALGE